MKQLNLPVIAGGALIALVLAQQSGMKLPNLSSPSLEVESAPEPSSALKASLEPLRVKLRTNKSKAQRIAQLYRQMVETLTYDNGDTIKATGQFYIYHGRALDTFAATDEPQIGAEIDAVIEKHMGGLKNVALTGEVRSKLLEALMGICWAAEQES